MRQRTNRRVFLMHSALAGVGLGQGVKVLGRGPAAGEKLRIAIVGAGGMGRSHVEDAHVKAEHVVGPLRHRRPQPGVGRQGPSRGRGSSTTSASMFDAMGKEIDAVICATPDHTHAVVTARALREGKHVYCQKPLTHTVHEARVIGELAKQNPKLATQMGNQGHSNEGARRVVEIVRAGAIGPVREVHAWTDRPIWPQGIDRPKDTPGPAEHAPLGPLARPHAPMRPYHEGPITPSTGAAGGTSAPARSATWPAMSSTPPFWALDLRHPTAIEAQCEGIKPETGPKWSIIRYEFPARGTCRPVTFTWYDGGKFPPARFVETYGLTTERQVREGDRSEDRSRARFRRQWLLAGGQQGR